MLFTGSPRTMPERAQELGVDRSTLYVWIQDPLFREYYEALREQVEAQRVNRMVPLQMDAADAVGAALRNALDFLNSADHEARKMAPQLPTLVEAFKKLVDIGRADAVATAPAIKPGKRKSGEKDTTKRGRADAQLNKLLDELVPPPAEDDMSEEFGASE